ncbi:hypothetical protein ACFOSC_07260 [Streptantibioticus rubrisoli]|uniref:Uncharacterized protein n=1 Tax=Streptantibioticus rubrisoli TaxID=1387313 RepID=A0ABT1P711_9ACTN|nr:hypothetical protein [Streptantibioticus rubrisoli]MCQ4041159.1 hypothetical protein [Streptantibioticus rubrisoli]
MFLLGILLVGATAAFVALAIVENFSGGGPGSSVTMLGHTIATLNALETFLAGMALALVFCLGLAMMTGSVRIHRRRRARYTARGAMAAREGEPIAGEPAAARGKPRHRRGLHIFGH